MLNILKDSRNKLGCSLKKQGKLAFWNAAKHDDFKDF